MMTKIKCSSSKRFETQRIFFFVLVSMILSNCRENQKTSIDHKKLSGKTKIIIDVTDLDNTAGKFRFIVGGKIFHPNIKGNQIMIETELEEPGRCSYSFFANQQLKASQVDLGDIPAKYQNHYTFLAVPGLNRIQTRSTISRSRVLSPSKAQLQYDFLSNLKLNLERYISESYPSVMKSVDYGKKDSVVKLFKSTYIKLYTDSVLAFIRDNPDSPVSLLELEHYSNEIFVDPIVLNKLYDQLTARLRVLPTARRLKRTIDSKSFASKLIGKIAPDFIQNNPIGKPVTIKDFRGKITLLEFWASWCGPCRASNPDLIKLYNSYHQKGFDILSVSLDENYNDWIKAIKDDKLIWTNISDLKSFDNKVAQQYHINSIPSNYLIDKSGNIIASNLDRKQLTAQLIKLLN